MHLESLQTTQDLLVCWCSQASIADLETAILILKSGLPDTHLSLLTAASLTVDPSYDYLSRIIILDTTALDSVIQSLRQSCFQAAIIFASPGDSPYSMAYLCYLAGIPIRIGQSKEFGGRVLSTCITPLPHPVNAIDHHLHLLKSLNLPIDLQVQSKIQNLKL